MKKEEKKKHKLDVHVDLNRGESYHPVVRLSNVFFPYQPYPQQVEIVETIQRAVTKGENALIESPTGTGKTICLLVGALSALVDSDSRKKVFYLTRTHSQISQVVSEFKKTVYSCHLNIIASREQFCINHNLSKLKGKILEKAC
jgi:regulator of telomere elongation helicase 1